MNLWQGKNNVEYKFNLFIKRNKNKTRPYKIKPVLNL